VKRFKLLVVQRDYNFSDEQTEYQVSDRLSFQQFAGGPGADQVPDTNT
jgi:IS5 family transposase